MANSMPDSAENWTYPEGGDPPEARGVEIQEGQETLEGQEAQEAQPISHWEYAPAPESREIANLRPSYRMFVNGEFVDGAGQPLRTINPATGENLAEVNTAASS